VTIYTSRLLSKIKSGQPVIGCAHMVQDPAVTETLRAVSLDFLIIDMQHVAGTVESLQRTLIALQPTELSVLVRPLWNDPPVIGQILDAGADGVIVPMVNTEDDARRAIAAARYPPEGNRSWGPRRAAALHGGSEEYARSANENVAVFTQVETAEAVKNLESILSVPGLSGVMVGPTDLAISLGYSHDRQNQVVQDKIQHVLDRCLERQVPFGFFAPSIESAVHWIERGSLVVTCSSDATFMLQGVAQLSSALRAASA
jgi:2-keto-3-deoxy-L-rhamnonate aldolase RhmA